MGSFMMRSPVIRNVGYDDMGSLRNAEFFDEIAGPANDFSGQGYDFIPSRLAKKVRNNDVKTCGLLKVGSDFQPYISRT